MIATVSDNKKESVTPKTRHREFRILFIGDIVGRGGRTAVGNVLPKLQKELRPDLVITNAENVAHGVGVTARTIAELMSYGIDVFTGGNHTTQNKKGFADVLTAKLPVLKPQNFPGVTAGRGFMTITKQHTKVLVASVMGQVFFKEKSSNPFRAIDEILATPEAHTADVLFFDNHTEATSEAVALGHYLDRQTKSRASVVVGSHTHVPTADARILPKGTGYITDVGMVGALESVLGVDTDIIINKMSRGQKLRHQITTAGLMRFDAVLATLRLDTNTCHDMRPIHLQINV